MVVVVSFHYEFASPSRPILGLSQDTFQFMLGLARSLRIENDRFTLCSGLEVASIESTWHLE
jgi:hypothetical protein